MDIPNPRRILILSPPDTPIASVLNALTTTPSPPSPDLHHQITTPYYTALIPIWTDTLLLPGWPSSWQHPSARPVIRALGAFVLVVRKPGCASEVEEVRGLLRAVNAVLEVAGGWEGVRGLVGVGRGVVGQAGEGKEEGTQDEEEEEEAWERMAREEGGWEWVDGEVDVGAGGRRGEFGELTGLARLREALEANEWDGPDADDLELETELGGLEMGEEEGQGFEAEAAEVQREMVELRRAVYEDGGGTEGGEEEQEEGEDIQVEELESMMLKMQAIRDMGADMPSSERKKFAAAAVRNIMKSI